MSIKKVELEPRKVMDIKGHFVIPRFQRGFRWSETEVLALLNDIYDCGGKSYCLQPLVLIKIGNDIECNYEVLDGQQRLTTLYLIFSYISRLGLAAKNYTIKYATRPDIPDEITEKEKYSNIDFLHLYNAYQTISDWFGVDINNRTAKISKLMLYFQENAYFIWYVLKEVDVDEIEASEIFRRLNIGKIPLTNAELVRASFLSRDTNDKLSEESQKELGMQWDQIEREMHDSSFWSFLSNRKTHDYPTRIELLFDMIACKKLAERERFYTFIEFNKRLKEKTIKSVWEEVLQYYQMLCDWYTDNDLYHLLGYIVTIDIKSLQEIASDVKNMKMGKKYFQQTYLPNIISKGLQISREQVLSLSYGKDNDKIEKVLLLFNVESIRNLSKANDRFPFHLYKEENWTLEHIHAQNSQGLNNKEDWQIWLTLHLQALEDMLYSVNSDERKASIEQLINRIKSEIGHLTNQLFQELFQSVTKFFSNDSDSSYIDQIQNMALLDGNTNSTISNLTFDVKRRLIMKRDYDNHFVPFCTKRVFAKFYSPSKDQTDLHFWTEMDRTGYINEIVGDGREKKGIITDFLKEDTNGSE